MADTKKQILIEVNLKDKSKAAFSQLKKDVGSFAKVGAIATAAVTALGAVVVKNTSNLEQMSVTFRTLTGSMKGAEALLSQIQKLSRESPFEIAELETMAQKILAYGFSLEEVIPLMEDLGDVAAALGGDTFERLVRAMGQTQAKGKLMGEEFRQLTETGLPIAQALAEKFGISVTELSQNLGKLNISFQDVREAVKQISDEKFGGLMQEQAETLAGSWNRVKNEIVIAARQVGMFTGAIETSKDVTDLIIDGINELKKVAIVAVSAIQAVVRWFISLYNTLKPLAPVLFAIVAAMGAFLAALKAMKIISGVIALIKGLTFSLGAAVVPIAAVTAGLAALAAVLAFLAIKHMSFSNSLDDMTAKFPKFESAGTKANKAISDSAKQAAESIADIKKQIEEENKAYEEQLANIVRNARERIEANKKALEEEKRAFEEAQAEREDKYDEEKGAIEEQTDERVAELEGYYEQTKQLDDENKEERLQQIREAIEQEKAAGQERLEALRQEYEEEKEAAQQSYEEKTLSLREQLEKDRSMLEKHSEDIKGIKIEEAKDEIEILKEKHQERLEELNSQLEKEKSARDEANEYMADSYGASLDAMGKDWDNFFEDFEMGLGDMKVDWIAVLEEVVGWLESGLSAMMQGLSGLVTGPMALVGSAAESLGELLGWEGLRQGGRNLQTTAGGITEQVGSIVSDYLDTRNFFDNKASGGPASGWTWVGESGAELVNFPQGSHVYNAEDSKKMMSGGGDIVINVNAPVTGVDNLKATILEAVDEATARQNRLAKYNLV